MRKNCLPYPVEFVDDAFGTSPVLAEVIKKTSGAKAPKLLIVADSNVVHHTENLGVKIGRYVREHSLMLSATPVVAGGGEKIKADNLQSLLKVLSVAVESKIGPGDVILALGGGSLLDLAGYAAAQVRGGVGLVRMPTTPAAMTGAAYSGFAALDFMGCKDVLKVASQPAAVVVDTSFAKTVLDGVWKGGVAEAVRIGVHDSKLLSKLGSLAESYARRDMEALSQIVKSVYGVVEKKGVSSYAQWISDRLETASGYKLPHGYAVAIGVLLELSRDVGIGKEKEETFDAALEILRKCGSLDGLVHSRHVLLRKDDILFGDEEKQSYESALDKVVSLRI